MDIYVLDDALRRIEVIDIYISLIWTERYSDIGEIELVMSDTPAIRNLIDVGTKLVIKESSRVMVIDTLDKDEADDGTSTIKFSGKSLESLLIDRACIPSLASLTTQPKWTLTGTPGSIARTIFDTVCRNATVDSGDAIPYLKPGTITPAGNISEPSDSITVDIDLGQVYDVTKKLLNMYNMGFRLVRNGEQSGLYYEVYMGNNRTSSQLTKSPVIFGKYIDSLSSITELKSVAKYKNVAYVVAKNGTRVVYAPDTDSTVSGFNRRVLMVSASDITLAAGAALDLALQQRGLEELAKNRIIIAFDGEIPKNSQYIYGIDYGLGDLIEVRDNQGKINNMRVTEQIFVSDREGDRSYPTLSFDMLITPGTWLAWPPQQVWADVPNTTNNEWADLP